MWLYYSEHKLQLVSDIRHDRANILARLMAGVPVVEVFAPYLKATEPTGATRRAA